MKTIQQQTLPKEQWPKELQSDFVKGVSVGVCIDGDASCFTKNNHEAHAHCSYWSVYYGWICFASKRKITRMTSLHELAHLMTPTNLEKDAHGPLWFKKFSELASNSFIDRVMFYASIFSCAAFKGQWSIFKAAFISYSTVLIAIMLLPKGSYLAALFFITWVLFVMWMSKKIIDRSFKNA